MKGKAVSVGKLAKKLLRAGGEQIELLREHDFKSDAAMHDEQLHGKLSAEFSVEVERNRKELAKTYGKPFRTGTRDCDLIPLSGIIRYAAWRLGTRRLFVAAAREERECPLVLVVGVSSGDTARGSEAPKSTRPPKQSKKSAQSRQPPLPGLRQQPRERCLYLALKPGETPERQQDEVYEQWGVLYKKWRRARKGNMLGGMQGPTFLVTLPDDESFSDFTVSSSMGGGLMSLLGQGLEILRETAQATGRCTASIQNGTVFVCDDGRRTPLAKCAYRRLRTDADYRVKGKDRKQHEPSPGS